MNYRYSETYDKPQFTPKQQQLMDALHPHTIHYNKFISWAELINMFGNEQNAKVQIGYMKSRLDFRYQFVNAYGLGYALVRKGTRHD